MWPKLQWSPLLPGQGGSKGARVKGEWVLKQVVWVAGCFMSLWYVAIETD